MIESNVVTSDLSIKKLEKNFAGKNVPHVPHVPHSIKKANRHRYLPCSTCCRSIRSDKLKRHEKFHENTKNKKIIAKSVRCILRKNNENSNILLSKKTKQIFRKSKRIFK